MIIIVEDRGTIADAFALSFGREGVAATSIPSDEINGWVEAAADEDMSAITAFLVGKCDRADEVANLIRRRSTAAIIAMNDHRSLSDTLELFAVGFDDVVTKPCHVREIMARIEAISRRLSARDPADDEKNIIRIFRDGRDPIVAGRPLQLPRRELRILELLVAKQGRRVTKSQIFSTVYGLFDQGIDECVVESHVSKLRRRLREILGYDPIESKRHLGYRLQLKQPRPVDQ